MHSKLKTSRTLLACAGLLALAACGGDDTTVQNESAADPNLNAGATPTEVIDDPSPGTDGTVLVDGQRNNPVANPPAPLEAGNDDSVADTTGNTQLQTGRQGQVGADQQAMATLQPMNGSQVSGSITFVQQSGGVAVQPEISGLAPGRYGFHIHEFGDCSAPDGSSAGEHWNPEDREHGDPAGNPGERHLGDLGNVEILEGGEARYDRIDPIISLTGPNSIVGKAIMVHSMEDDLMTQPSGNSGDPLACGVIEGDAQVTQAPQGGAGNP